MRQGTCQITVDGRKRFVPTRCVCEQIGKPYSGIRCYGRTVAVAKMIVWNRPSYAACCRRHAAQYEKLIEEKPETYKTIFWLKGGDLSG